MALEEAPKRSWRRLAASCLGVPTGAAPHGLPAEMVENAVHQEIRRLARTATVAQQEQPDIDDREVIAALNEFDAMWSSLFTAEQARIIHLLEARVTIAGEGIAVDLRTAGIGPVVRDMLVRRPAEAVA